MTYSILEGTNEELLFDEGITSEIENIDVDANEIYRGRRGELAVEYFSFRETLEHKKLQGRLAWIFYSIINRYGIYMPENEEEFVTMEHDLIEECADLFGERAARCYKRIPVESETLKDFLMRRYDFYHFLTAPWRSYPFKMYIDKCVEDEIWCDYSTFRLACETGVFPNPQGQDEHGNLSEAHNWTLDKDMFAHLTVIRTKAMSEEHPMTRVYRELDTDGFLAASILEVFRHGHIIKRCPNCGKYFIPYRRKSAIYCDRPSPQSPARTCRQYAGSTTSYKKKSANEAKKKENNVRQVLKMRALRNRDIPYLQNAVRVFNDEVDEWREAMEYGKKTEDEFLDWLENLKRTEYDEIFTQSQEELNE